MFCGSGIDWAATGTMLQGLGTIIGAIAIIVAALIGGTSFKSWRRQQLVQKHMAIAEQIMTAIFNAKEEVSYVRSPLKTGVELDAAGKLLEANGFKLDQMDDARARRMRSGQATMSRLNRFAETWKELETSKAAAYAFFGEDIPKQIDRILRQVHIIRVDAEEYADYDGNDEDFRRTLLSTLTSSRVRGDYDKLAEEIEEAIKTIEDRLKPFLQEATTETRKVLAEALRKSLVATTAVYGFPSTSLLALVMGRLTGGRTL